MLTTNFLGNKFSWHRALLLIATLIGTTATYMYQVFAARILGPFEFGLLASFLAIISNVGLAFSGLSTVSFKSSKFSAEDSNTNISWRLKSDKIFFDLIRLLFPISLLLILFALFFGQNLNLGTIPFAFSVATIPLTAVFAVAVGRLQSRNENQTIAWSSAIFSILKLLTLIPLAIFTLGATTAVIQIFFVSLVSTIFLMRKSRNISPGRSELITKSNLMVLTIFPLFWLAQSSDIIFSQVHFGSKVSGNYAANVTIGRIIVLVVSIYLQYSLYKLSKIGASAQRLINKYFYPVLLLWLIYIFLMYFLGSKVAMYLFGSEFEFRTSSLLFQALIALSISFNLFIAYIGLLFNTRRILMLFLFYFLLLFFTGTFSSHSIIFLETAFLTSNLVINLLGILLIKTSFRDENVIR